MGIQLFLGKPPQRVKQWIKDHYGPKLDEPLCFTAIDAGATIAFNKIGNPDDARIVTSVDTQNWTPYTFGTEITLTNVGDKVYFRAADENDISFYKDDNNYYRFTTAITEIKKIAASGNIQTLMKADGSRLDISEKINCYSGIFGFCLSLTTAPKLPATTLAEGCYANMFVNCSFLTTAPKLPAMILTKSCYENMFEYCSSLTTAPKLPATTLAINCYNSMFAYCSSLTAAPELPARTLVEACYANMFAACSSLTVAPALPATTLAECCYQAMFFRCSSLTTAPELPVTTLVEGCYESMFFECSSLTTAPELPATSLVEYCYADMFYDCSSLTTAPKLPATTLAECCYAEMFYDCNKLTSVNVNFSAWSPSSATSEWLVGVAKSGTFTCPAVLPDNRDANHIPVGWTRIEK